MVEFVHSKVNNVVSVQSAHSRPKQRNLCDPKFALGASGARSSRRQRTSSNRNGKPASKYVQGLRVTTCSFLVSIDIVRLLEISHCKISPTDAYSIHFYLKCAAYVSENIEHSL